MTSAVPDLVSPRMEAKCVVTYGPASEFNLNRLLRAGRRRCRVIAPPLPRIYRGRIYKREARSCPLVAVANERVTQPLVVHNTSVYDSR